jgi:hypothetical protein
MNKLLRVLVFLGALLLVVAVMVLLGVRSEDRRAFQKYQAELQAKGEKLTFAELTRGRQTNAVDSHTLITNAVVKLSGARLVPGLLDVRRYVGPGRASVAWRQASPKASPTWVTPIGPGGSLGTWDEFTAQMQAAQGTLQEIREALKEPSADAGPYTNMLVGRRLNFVAIRTAAQWLMGAAETDLHQGGLGLQDLEALAALARMERDEYTLVAQMIRVAVAGMGLGVTWDALQAPGWTEPQLARLQKAWEAVDLAEAVEKGFVGERASGYAIFGTARHTRGPQIAQLFRVGSSAGSSPSKATIADVLMEYLYFPVYKLTSIDADELFYLNTVQEGITTLRLVRAQRPWPEARKRGLTAVARITTIASSPSKVRYCLSMMCLPNYTRAGDRGVETEVERQMALAAIALKRYELRHGKLPASLEALVPEFLSTMPYDYMAAKPLGYHLKTDGSYVLYSVGEDGKDDGGDPTPPPGTPPGLWGGRDAVWPSPEAQPGEPPRQPDR